MQSELEADEAYRLVEKFWRIGDVTPRTQSVFATLLFRIAAEGKGEAEIGVGEIAHHMNLTRPPVSQSVSKLLKVVVISRRTGRHRGPLIYRIEAHAKD